MSASFDISVRRWAGAEIVSLRGRLDATVAPEVREQLEAIAANHPTGVALELSEVAFIDSSGLGVLVATWETVLRKRGNVVLLNPSVPVRRSLELTRLDSVFRIAEHDLDAAAHFVATNRPRAEGRSCDDIGTESASSRDLSVDPAERVAE